MMNEVGPGLCVAGLVTAALCAAQLMPMGTGLFVVRVDRGDPAAGLEIAARADASLVSTPADGVAVLYGDASRLRRSAGLVVAWNGRASCSAVP